MPINNNAQFVGRLTKDPEIRTAGETKVAAFTLAVDRSYVDKETGQRPADFIEIEAFGKSADSVEKYFHKGNRVIVQGEIRNRKPYTNKDGQKVYPGNIVILSEWKFAESKKNDDGGNRSQAPAPAGGAADGADEELPYDY